MLGSTLRTMVRTVLVPRPRFLSKGVRITDIGLQLDESRALLHVETRNMCRCRQCFGEHSHQKVGLPASGGNLYPGVTISDLHDVSDHYVHLSWSDGHKGFIARTVQGEYGPHPVPNMIEKYLDLTMRRNRAQVFWDGPTDENYRFFEYESVISSTERRREFFAHYMTHGIAFLKGVPPGRQLIDVIDYDLKCGPVNETLFDKVDIVRYKDNPINAGYASGSLACHTDLNYYYQNPHVQMFQSLENTVEGGESFWVDSFPVVRELMDEKPDYFEVLCRVPVFHRFTPPGTDKYIRSHHPLITMLGKDILRVNDNPWSTDTPLSTLTQDLDTRVAWWDAYLYFRSKMEDRSRWIVRKLGAGEVVVTDNWRIYHGREAFRRTDPGQERVVATAYISWNHVQRILLSPDEACFLEIDA